MAKGINNTNYFGRKEPSSGQHPRRAPRVLETSYKMLFVIPRPLYRDTLRYADKEQIPLSDVVRDALRYYLREVVHETCPCKENHEHPEEVLD